MKLISFTPPPPRLIYKYIYSLSLLLTLFKCNPSPKKEQDPTELFAILGLNQVQSPSVTTIQTGNLTGVFQSKCGEGVTCRNIPIIISSSASLTNSSPYIDFNNIHVHISSIPNTVAGTTRRSSTMVLTNTGTGDVTVNEIISETSTSNTSITFSPILNNQRIAPGESLDIVVTFAPTVRSQVSQIFRIRTTNNRDNAQGGFKVNGKGTDYRDAICPSGNFAGTRVRNLETVTRTIHLFPLRSTCQANNTSSSNSNALGTFLNVAPNTVSPYQCINFGSSRNVFIGDGNGAGGCTTTSSALSINDNNLITNSQTSINLELE